jgi:hypothetical protein
MPVGRSWVDTSTRSCPAGTVKLWTLHSLQIEESAFHRLGTGTHLTHFFPLSFKDLANHLKLQGTEQGAKKYVLPPLKSTRRVLINQWLFTTTPSVISKQ